MVWIVVSLCFSIQPVGKKWKENGLSPGMHLKKEINRHILPIVAIQIEWSCRFFRLGKDAPSLVLTKKSSREIKRKGSFYLFSLSLSLFHLLIFKLVLKDTDPVVSLNITGRWLHKETYLIKTAVFFFLRKRKEQRGLNRKKKEKEIVWCHSVVSV